MKYKEHLRSTNGKGGEIHRFMDQYGDKVDFRPDHRVIFHHKKGMEHIVKLFGEEARHIVAQHLKDDEYGTIYRRMPEDHNDSIFKDVNEEVRKLAERVLNGGYAPRN